MKTAVMWPMVVEKPKVIAARCAVPDARGHRDPMEQYLALGPLLSDDGSRAFLGLRIAGGAASPCALVFVPDSIAREPEKMESLRRETERVSALEHQNILRVFGLAELDEGLARAVEYADAESLRRILKAAVRLPAPIAARVVLDAALGVQYAHLVGNDDGTPLIHSELRPETLFVSYSGVTKVAGYGAHALAEDSKAAGEPRHRAPEQILGGQGAVSEQTDVYLLGALLYETLTGEAPTRGKRDFGEAVIDEVPALLHSTLLPDALRPLISKAMAEKSERRYATVLAFREALEEAIAVADPPAVADFIEGVLADDDLRMVRKQAIDRGIQEWSAEASLSARASLPPLPSALPGPHPRTPRLAATDRPPKPIPEPPAPKPGRLSEPEKWLPSAIEGEEERAPRRKYSLRHAATLILLVLMGAASVRSIWTHRFKKSEAVKSRATGETAPTAGREAPAVPAAKAEASALAISSPNPPRQMDAGDAPHAVRNRRDRHHPTADQRRRQAGPGALARERAGGKRPPPSDARRARPGR
jgi:hypothetical protein